MGRKAKRAGGGYKPAEKTPVAEKRDEEEDSDEEEASDADESIESVPLLEENGDATKSFKQILVALFGRFDADKDRLLNEAELKAFSRAANEDEREFTAEEIEEMHDHFDWTEVGPDGGAGGLNLRGFIEMYVTQTQGEPEETWRDLLQLGYDRQLKLRSAEPEAKLPRSASLRAALERFAALAAGDDVEAFVDAFVATDIDREDRAAFAADLKRDDRKQLQELLLELLCCASGKGVFRIEAKKEKDGTEKSPVTFHFRSPHPGAERVDRAVTFVLDGCEWRADG